MKRESPEDSNSEIPSSPPSLDEDGALSQPRGPVPLDPAPAVFEALVAEATRRLSGFLRELPDAPSHMAETFETGADWLADRLPEEPGVPGPILDLLFEHVIPQALNPASPGYFAYIPGGGIPSAAVAELIASVVNRYTGLWIAAPGPVELETQAIRWLAELLGMRPGTLGVITSGGSMSNLIALVAARDKLLGASLSGGVVYASSEVHHCLWKAARIAGLAESQLRSIEIDEHRRIRVDRLEEAIRADRARGLEPFFVCGSAGTVTVGAMDPLDALAGLCEREGLWFHVDGAYGAAFACVKELAPLFRGMERADSVAVDPHKGLFLPYGLGVLLVKDVAELKRSYSAFASYLPSYQDDHERLDFCELTPELSRDWRGLRLWLPFCLHGARAFRDALRERHEWARWASRELAGELDVDVQGPDLSLFAFRRRVEEPREDANRRQRRVLAEIIADRRALLTPTELDGELWIRMVVLHLRTTRARVEETVERIVGAIRRDRASGG